MCLSDVRRFVCPLFKTSTNASSDNLYSGTQKDDRATIVEPHATPFLMKIELSHKSPRDYVNEIKMT